LMRLMGLEAVYPKPHLSAGGAGHKVYPYLLRNVPIERVNQVWSTDITYIPMPNGFMYLTAVIDWYSRYVLSWKLSNTLDVGFCLEALEEWTRRLADTMAVGVAPVQALVRSADHAPTAITAEVTALANALSTPRLDRGVALRRFADEIDDSLGDMITLSLEIAVSAQASQRVPDVLRTMAAGVAEEVKARRAVEADRAGPRNEARMIVIVQVLFVLGVATLTSYTKIYGTLTGQMVLAVLGAAVVLALWLLRKYSSAEAPPRLLGAAGGRR